MNDLTVLVAAVNKTVDLFTQMNITTPCIVANQSVSEGKFVIGDKVFISLNERGVGLNRNTALNRCTTKYAVLADDDQVFVDQYDSIIIDSFAKYPDADVLIFNIDDPSCSRYIIKENHKISWLNFARYGAVRIAFKTESIHRKNIHFHQFFGGGAKFSHGEDSIFLADCLRNKLKIYGINQTIARLNEDDSSSWFTGYNEKYFYDKGILGYCMFKKFAYLFCVQDAIRNYRKYQSEISLLKRITLAFNGIKAIKTGNYKTAW